MEAFNESYDALLQAAANRLRGHQRRLFLAEVTLQFLRRQHPPSRTPFRLGTPNHRQRLAGTPTRYPLSGELRSPRTPRWEEEGPQRTADLRAIAEPHTQADPELLSERRYTNLTAAEMLEVLAARRATPTEDLPSERSMRDILNRMGYRLKRIQKAKPLKKTPETDAIFANVKAVRQEVTATRPRWRFPSTRRRR